MFAMGMSKFFFMYFVMFVLGDAKKICGMKKTQIFGCPNVISRVQGRAAPGACRGGRIFFNIVHKMLQI